MSTICLGGVLPSACGEDSLNGPMGISLTKGSDTPCYQKKKKDIFIFYHCLVYYLLSLVSCKAWWSLCFISCHCNVRCVNNSAELVKLYCPVILNSFWIISSVISILQFRVGEKNIHSFIQLLFHFEFIFCYSLALLDIANCVLCLFSHAIHLSC